MTDEDQQDTGEETQDPRRGAVLLLASKGRAIGRDTNNPLLHDISEAIYHLLANSTDVIMMDANRDSYYDVLCPFDESPDNMKIGDNIVGTVKEINIAHDGTPGVFLKNIKITH